MIYKLSPETLLSFESFERKRLIHLSSMLNRIHDMTATAKPANSAISPNASIDMGQNKGLLPEITSISVGTNPNAGSLVRPFRVRLPKPTNTPSLDTSGFFGPPRGSMGPTARGNNHRLERNVDPDPGFSKGRFDRGFDVDPGFGRAPNGILKSNSQGNVDPGFSKVPTGILKSNSQGSVDLGFTLPLPSLTTPTKLAGFGQKVTLPVASGSAETTVVTLNELRALNPTLKNVSEPAEISEGSFQMFGADTSRVKELTAEYGYITLKPIDMGSGVFLPVGTKIGDTTGIRPIGLRDIQPGISHAAITFELPNGKKMEMRQDSRSGSGTSIKFGDGSTLRMAGAPFFNPATGKLGWVRKSKAESGAQQGNSFALRGTVFDSKTDAKAMKSLAETLK